MNFMDSGAVELMTSIGWFIGYPITLSKLFRVGRITKKAETRFHRVAGDGGLFICMVNHQSNTVTGRASPDSKQLIEIDVLENEI